jgi:hypothetical protein
MIEIEISDYVAQNEHMIWVSAGNVLDATWVINLRMCGTHYLFKWKW